VIRTVPRRPDLRERVFKLSGQWQVPLLVDRERDVVLPESKAILAYLREHYRRAGTPA
jgi:glutathione S-transferase